MVDQRHRRVEADRQRPGISCDQRAVPFLQPPIIVARCVFVRRPIVKRDVAEVSAVGIARDGVDHRTPWRVRGDEVAQWPVGAIRVGGRALMPVGIGLAERGVLARREAEIVPLLAPVRIGAVDLKPFGERYPGPWVAIGRMQPRTTQIKYLAANADAVRSSADPAARLDQQHVRARFVQPPRRRYPRRTAADDDEILLHAIIEVAVWRRCRRSRGAQGPPRRPTPTVQPNTRPANRSRPPTRPTSRECRPPSTPPPLSCRPYIGCCRPRRTPSRATRAR